MPVNHDYYCKECETEHSDVVYNVPFCCGKPMSIHFGRITGPSTFNPNNSSMYGKYHPGFGCIVEDYAHKQRLLKQYDVIEASDPVRGSRQHERPPGYRGPNLDIDKSKLPAKDEGPGGWINGPEDLQRMEKEALDGVHKN